MFYWCDDGGFRLANYANIQYTCDSSPSIIIMRRQAAPCPQARRGDRIFSPRSLPHAHHNGDKRCPRHVAIAIRLQSLSSSTHNTRPPLYERCRV